MSVNPLRVFYNNAQDDVHVSNIVEAKKKFAEQNAQKQRDAAARERADRTVLASRDANRRIGREANARAAHYDQAVAEFRTDRSKASRAAMLEHDKRIREIEASYGESLDCADF